MSKEELLQFEGLVLEILPDARYRVQLDNGHVLIAYTAGRMKKNRIKTLAGDRVTVEVSPYDCLLYTSPKLTVPMILFFLPVLFIVILGPAAIRVMAIQ